MCSSDLREVLRERIARRLRERLGQGMIEEVQRLRDAGLSWERLDEMGLEYRYVSLYLRGELAFEDMVRTLNVRIRQFAKRQDTWFRGMERRGIAIHWIEGADGDALGALVRRELRM